MIRQRLAFVSLACGALAAPARADFVPPRTPPYGQPGGPPQLDANGLISAFNIPRVSTIAALRAGSTAGLTDQSPVQVTGYSAAGDAGGGTFIWSASSAAADDGCTVFLPTGRSGAGRWLRYTLYNAITPEMCGSAHDGVTDDTAVINAAMAVQAARGGGVVELGPYRYAVGASADVLVPFNSNVTLQGGWNWPGAQRPSANYATTPYTLVLNASHTIRVSYGDALRNLVVYRSGLFTPASMRDGINLVAAFAGTGVTLGSGSTSQTGTDTRVENVLVLGFSQCLASANNPRINVNNLYGDCTNGLSLDNSHDVSRINNVHFWQYLTANQSWTFSSYVISGAADNGSGAIRLTIPTNGLVTGDTVHVAGVLGLTGANNRWPVTVVDATHIDLVGSLTAGTTATAATTVAQNVITITAANANIAPGQVVSGTGIAGGTTVKAIAGTKIILSANAQLTNASVTLTFTNGSYTSGGNTIVNLTRRAGTAFLVTNSEEDVISNSFEYGFDVGYHIGTGAGWTQLIGDGGDNYLIAADPNTVAILIDGSSYGSTILGGIVSSDNQAITVNSTGTSAHKILGVTINPQSSNIVVDLLAGIVAFQGNNTPGSSTYMYVDPGMTRLELSGNDFAGTNLTFPAAQTLVYNGGGNSFLNLPNTSFSLGANRTSLTASAVYTTAQCGVSNIINSATVATMTLPAAVSTPAGCNLIVQNVGTAYATIAVQNSDITSDLLSVSPGEVVMFTTNGNNTWRTLLRTQTGGYSMAKLIGTSGSIGGSALAAGACSSGTVTITGATTAMNVDVTPATYPGDGFTWSGYVSGTNTVTVRVCAAVAGTPTASTYSVRVLN